MPLEAVSVTIAGAPFQVMERYEEGHELTAGEASALNQTLRENVRNNLAKKEGLTQADVDAYAAEYEFGVRTPGAGRTADPIMTEYMRLARVKIKEALKAKGKSADAEAINEAAKKMISTPHGEAIMALAKQRVEEAKSIASDVLGDIVNDIPEKAPAAAETAPPSEPQQAA